MDQTQNFSPRSWFFELFGFDESVESVRSNIHVEEKEDHTDLISKLKEGRIYNAGNFKVRTSDRKTYDIPKKGSYGGKLHIIHGYGPNSRHFELIDILAMQSLEPWNGATYLAASNFNCLEFISRGQTALQGVTNYYGDITQGPYTALACGPAAVYRNYFIKHKDPIDNQIEYEGQITKQIELLEDTPIPVVNGYALINKDSDLAKKFLPKLSPIEKVDHNEKKFSFKKLLFWKKTNNDSKSDRYNDKDYAAANQKLSKFNWKEPSIWKVGVHRNCQVVMTRGPKGTFSYAPENRIAHHVYAAALNFTSDVVQTEMTRMIARELLAAEYRAAVLAAWENSVKYSSLPGSKKLSLTLLGGGVFSNPLNMICDAIGENVELIKESGLDVYITCFNDATFREVERYLGEAVRQTGGTIIDTNDDQQCQELIELHMSDVDDDH